ncbi:MAG: hypothetical protein LCH41_05565 [Armatimonadetes bacterium]|nr:hypothetical protein [Armatimonadota bacterium]
MGYWEFLWALTFNFVVWIFAASVLWPIVVALHAFVVAIVLKRDLESDPTYYRTLAIFQMISLFLVVEAFARLNSQLQHSPAGGGIPFTLTTLFAGIFASSIAYSAKRRQLRDASTLSLTQTIHIEEEMKSVSQARWVGIALSIVAAFVPTVFQTPIGSGVQSGMLTLSESPAARTVVLLCGCAFACSTAWKVARNYRDLKDYARTALSEPKRG